MLITNEKIKHVIRLQDWPVDSFSKTTTRRKWLFISYRSLGPESTLDRARLMFNTTSTSPLSSWNSKYPNKIHLVALILVVITLFIHKHNLRGLLSSPYNVLMLMVLWPQHYYWCIQTLWRHLLNWLVSHQHICSEKQKSNY